MQALLTLYRYTHHYDIFSSNDMVPVLVWVFVLETVPVLALELVKIWYF